MKWTGRETVGWERKTKSTAVTLTLRLYFGVHQKTENQNPYVFCPLHHNAMQGVGTIRVFVMLA